MPVLTTYINYICGTIPSGDFSDWFYSSTFLKIGDFTIAKYAICILTGIIIAFFVCTVEAKKMNIKRDDILDCMLFIVPLSIIGARVWYMCGDGSSTFANYMNSYGFFNAIFYTFMYTIGFEYVPASWAFTKFSGLAIHGAILVAFVGTVICCRIKKWRLTSLLDIVAPGLLIGQICGRWGNFFNQEAHGTVVGGFQDALVDGKLVANLSVSEQYDVLVNTYHIPKWIVVNMYMDPSKAEYVISDNSTLDVAASYYYQPTFLYESMWNLLGLGLYFIFRRNKRVRSGDFVAYYLIWYGVGRFFIEAIRMDSLYITGTSIKMAQATSVLMVVLGIFLLLLFHLIHKSKHYMEIINETTALRLEESKTKGEDKIIVIDESAGRKNKNEAVPKKKEKPDEEKKE